MKQVLRAQQKSFDIFDILVAVSAGIMFGPTFCRLATLGWIQADYTHAYFIFPIFIWLVARKKKLLAKSEDLSLFGAVLFTAGLTVYVFSALSRFMFLEGVSLVVVVWGLFKLKFTRESYKKILFPLAYLIFLIPPPKLVIDTVTSPLKIISTDGSYFLLKLVHLPVSVHGAILKVGEYELFVADACSGFRSMVTLLALGALYSYLQPLSAKKKWTLFLSTIPLGIAGNTLRLFLTGCIAHFAGIRYAEGFFHELSGAVMFIFTVLGLMFISTKLTSKPSFKT